MPSHRYGTDLLLMRFGFTCPSSSNAGRNTSIMEHVVRSREKKKNSHTHKVWSVSHQIIYEVLYSCWKRKSSPCRILHARTQPCSPLPSCRRSSLSIDPRMLSPYRRNYHFSWRASTQSNLSSCRICDSCSVQIVKRMPWGRSISWESDGRKVCFQGWWADYRFIPSVLFAVQYFHIFVVPAFLHIHFLCVV